MSDDAAPGVPGSGPAPAGSVRRCRPPAAIGGREANRARLARTGWVAAATDVLAGQGFSALTVPRIAERLRVPERTFSTHFESHDDLVAAVLERWKAIDTDEMLQSLDRIALPRERLARFVEFGFERHHWGRVGAALGAGASHPRVGPAVTAVRAARLTFLERALSELGLCRPQARDRAALIHAAYVGFWALVADDPRFEYHDARRLHRVAEHVKQALIPSPAELGAPSGPGRRARHAALP